MGLTFEGETIEDEIIEEVRSPKRRRRLKKPVLVAIILISVSVVLGAAWTVVKKFFPNLIPQMTRSVDEGFVADETGAYSDWTVMERVSADMEQGFAMQLPQGVNAKAISIENHYRDRALLIRLSGIKASDFVSTYVSGNVSEISVVAWKAKDNEILVSFQMSEIWEYEVTQEGSKLVVKNTAVRELYDTVVVLDPIYSSSISDDVTAEVAEACALLAAENGVKVYITRGIGSERSEAERLALILDTDADYVIEISVSADSDSSKYGLSAYYNDRYYNPACDNVSVADTVLKNLATTVKNRANAIEPAAEDSLLMLVKQPAAGVNIGFSSNSDEWALLQKDSYRKALAIGILNGINEMKEE
ncbi:MAG: N-acetylmuramoyl-L-alanine amidase [Lachnospiraceae bacterium]|nr:N-acetylmuramoyl-L-alanine amidase [Lachnospiraceae bacterium]